MDELAKLLRDYGPVLTLVSAAGAQLMRYRTADKDRRLVLSIALRDFAPYAVTLLLLWGGLDARFGTARVWLLIAALFSLGTNVGVTYGIYYGWKRWWDRALREVDIHVSSAKWSNGSVCVEVSVLNRSPLEQKLHAFSGSQMLMTLTPRGSPDVILTHNTSCLSLLSGDKGRNRFEFTTAAAAPPLSSDSVLDARLEIKIAGHAALVVPHFPLWIVK